MAEGRCLYFCEGLEVVAGLTGYWRRSLMNMGAAGIGMAKFFAGTVGKKVWFRWGDKKKAWDEKPTRSCGRTGPWF